ncbi:MAG: polysaccharide biosynthesis protein [Epulopiscium sp.]|nr:polysaccharide biosynthesis protein [Candidatus Epulonipiscium sp.]
MARKNKGITLAKHGAILAIAALIVRFIGFIYRVPLTRMIGDDGNGLYSTAYQIYTFFFILSSAGIPIAVSKLVAEKIALKQYGNAHKIFQVATVFGICTGGFFSLLLWFGSGWISQWIKSPRSMYSLKMLAPTLFIVAIMGTFRGYFQGMNTMVPTAVSQVIEQIFNAVSSIVLATWLMPRGVEFGAAGGTLGTGIGAVGGLAFLLLLYIPLRPKLKKRIKKYSHKENLISFSTILHDMLYLAFPIIIGTAILSVTNLIDLAMVRRGLNSLGYTEQRIDQLYGILTGKYVVLTTLPISLATALATATVPSISASVARNEKEVLENKMNLVLRFTMLLSAPAATGLMILANPIIILLFPNQTEGGLLLQVGSVAIIFFALAQVATAVLQGLGKVYVPVRNSLYSSIVKIAGNFIFIYLFDLNIVGAVISTSLFAFMVCFLDLKNVVKNTKVSFDYGFIFGKPMIASSVMGIFCFLFYKIIFWGTQHNAIATIGSIGLSMIVYFSILFVIQGITREEIQMFPMGDKIIVLMEKRGLLKV